MRGMILAAALLLISAGASPALPPLRLGVGVSGQSPTPHHLQSPLNFGVYTGHHTYSFPSPHGYQPWTPNPYYHHGYGPQPFHYYYDPSFSSFGLPSVPGVGPFEGWNAQPFNFVR